MSSSPANPAAGAGFRRGRQFSVTAESLDLGGRGLVHCEAQPVAVDDLLPGETATIEIIQTPRGAPQPRQARARVVTLQASPYPARLAAAGDAGDTAACPGAPWLPVPLGTQAAWKQQIAERTLATARAALEPALQERLPTAAMRPLVPSPQATGYRNKAEFTCGYGRIERIDDPRHPGAGRTIPEGFDPAVGFHRPGAWQTVHSFDHCPILPEFMRSIRRKLDAVCRHSTAVDNYRPWCDKGCRRTVMLRGGDGFDRRQLLIALKTGGDPTREQAALSELKQALSDEPDLNLHWLCVEEGSHPRGTEPVRDLAGEPWITARFCGRRLRLRPASFFQVNLAAAEQLVAGLASHLRAAPVHTLLDLYCGVGTLGLALADSAQRIVGVETVAAAVADARENAALNAIAAAEYIAAPAEKTLGELFAGPLGADLPHSVALIDPPRAGLHPKALKALCAAPIPRLAYVACNPAALAHDLPALAQAGYRLEALTPYDFFPHTPHLEQLAWLVR